jgi:hypothetical protein
MSTFYVLPPRLVIGDRLAAFLQTFLPGIDWDVAGRVALADAAAEATVSETAAFVVFRDDLPFGERVGQALIDGFGADADDEVVEVRLEGRTAAPVAQRWRIGDRWVPPANAA